jgi:hypothetical protein
MRSLAWMRAWLVLHVLTPAVWTLQTRVLDVNTLRDVAPQ